MNRKAVAAVPTPAAVFAAAMLFGVPAVVLAPTAPAHAQAEDANAQKRITLDLRDAPIRSALEQLFNSARVDFSIDNNVQGFVTLKVTDQPFDGALRLILRSASTPLTYTRENNVYIIRPRTITATTGAGGPSGPNAPDITGAGEGEGRQGTLTDQINFTYADPFDLAGVLGITILPVGTRDPGGMGGGMMGGMGGGMMGGGMMGGMGGGMMGGGMMGGGFGGGRGF